MIRSLGLASASSLEKRIKKELQEQGVLEAEYGNEVRELFVGAIEYCALIADHNILCIIRKL